jgi:hypothetical protein
VFLTWTDLKLMLLGGITLGLALAALLTAHA